MIYIMKTNYENNIDKQFKLNIHLWFVSREQFWFFYRRQNVAVKHVLPLNIKYYERFCWNKKTTKETADFIIHTLDGQQKINKK